MTPDSSSVQAVPLLGRDVHIWAGSLVATPAQIDSLRRVLSEDECVRAGRFRLDDHRVRFIAARATLRRILTAYVGMAASEIRFEYGGHGKPRLGHPVGTDITFNTSHSDRLVLIGVTRGRAIGVDVERRRQVDNLALAERFFTAAELAALSSLPEIDRHEGFLNCWTRKEAYLKALGCGLSAALDSFSVSLTPGESAAVTWTRAGGAETSRWTMRAVPLGTDYVGAVVTEQVGHACVFRHIPFSIDTSADLFECFVRGSTLP